MATIKSFTDIFQSKKLADILPLESADMSYSFDFDSRIYEISTTSYKNLIVLKYAQLNNDFSQIIPCWSLAALLSVIPDYRLISEHNYHMCTAETNFEKKTRAWFFNPVDACVAMIEKLRELKML